MGIRQEEIFHHHHYHHHEHHFMGFSPAETDSFEIDGIHRFVEFGLLSFSL